MATPKFTQGKGDFHTVLKQRVNEYFTERNQSMTGNFSLLFNAVLFVLLYLAIYLHLVFFTPLLWIAIPECIFFGLLTAAIGFNVIHHAPHVNRSQSKILTNAASCSLSLLGVSVIMWVLRDNIIHHTYAKIDGNDDDLEARAWLI